MTALADHNEQAAFVPERANPADLREPSLRLPIVSGLSEQFLRVFARISADECARISSNIVDAVLADPALHLSESVAVLLGMLVLIAQPRFPSRRLALAVA